MKKSNLILFFILCLLIGGGYFLEEVYKPQEKNKKVDSKSLFSIKTDLTAFSTEKYDLIKQENGKWKYKNVNWPVDQTKIKSFINILKKMSYQEKFEVSLEEKKRYFSDNKIEFSVVQNGHTYSYLLGNISYSTGAFYIAKKEGKEIYICQDNSHFEQPYQSELDLKIKKYARFQHILKSQIRVFAESDLFYSLRREKIKSVKIDNKRNRWFEVDLIGKKTIPEIIAPLNYKKLEKTILTLMNGVQVEDVLLSRRLVLTDKFSEILVQVGHESKVFKLYLGANGEYGKYIKIPEEKYVLKVKLDAKNIFYSNVQDFWQKKIIFNKRVASLKRLDFLLKKPKSKTVKFFIDDLEKFVVKSKEKNVKFISRIHMNFLFNLIFNLTHFKEAKYIQHDSDNIVENYDLRLDILDKTFYIKQNTDLIHVFDEKEKLSYFYEYNTQQISHKFLTQIFTVK